MEILAPLNKEEMDLLGEALGKLPLERSGNLFFKLKGLWAEKVREGLLAQPGFKKAMDDVAAANQEAALAQPDHDPDL